MGPVKYKDLLPSYSNKLDEDAANMLHNIKLGLGWSIGVRDLQRGVGFYLRLLNRYFDFKYTLEEQDRAQIINLLLECINLPGPHDMALLTKWISALNKLLKKHKTTLNISWHFVFNLLNKVIPFPSSTTESSFNGKNRHFLEAVLKLAKHAQKHYDQASSLEAIFGHFRPYFCPHDNIIFTAQALLVTLSPSQIPPSSERYIEEVLSMWNWVNGISDWDYNWISLLSGWAKSQPKLDWSPYLATIFQHFLQVFDLSLAGGHAILKPAKHRSPSEVSVFHTMRHGNRDSKVSKMAKLIAYMDRADGNTQSFLNQLFASIKSYYHPSNLGDWSEGLGVFAEYLCKYYAKRAVRENKPLSAELLECVKIPLQYALYGKKDSLRAAACSAYLHLAYVAPEIFELLIPRVYEALETLTAPHQTRAVLEALSTLAHPLFARSINPKGGSYMSLLPLTLPGIDANDIGKTTATYKFYYRLLTVLPIIEGGDSGLSQTPFDEDAFSATYTFSEWLSNKEDETSHSLALLFKASMDQFFMQLSEPLYQQALQKLYSTITGNRYEKSLKEVGVMCAAASHAQPELALKLFVPFYFKNIVDVDKSSGQESMHGISEDQLLWHLTLLATIVNQAGSTVMQYEKQLTSILKVSLAAETPKVYKAAHKLLRALLNGLVQYYPLDSRSENPEVWRSKEFIGGHYMRWGNTGEYKVTWHEPSPAELQMAHRIIEATLAPAITGLTTVTAGGEPYARATTLRNLQRLRAVLRGAAPIMRPAAIPHITPFSPEPERADHRGWCATTSPPVIAGAYPPEFILSSAREKIAKTIHAVTDFILQHKPDETGAIKVICKVAQNLFTNYGITPSRLNHDPYNTLKHKWRNVKKLNTRNFAVARAQLLLVNRRYIDSHATSSTEGSWTSVILRDLLRLSLNAYTEVRVRAQTTLNSAVVRHPLEMKPLAQQLLSTLATTALNNKDELTGTLHLLMNPRIMRKIVSDWSLRNEFATAFIACLGNQQQNQQRTDVWDHHTQSYFTKFAAFSCVQFRAIPVQLPPIATSSFSGYLPTETLAKAQLTLAEHNNANKHSFQQIIATLASVLDDKTTFNWKFKVMAVAQIWWQARSGIDLLMSECIEAQAHVANTFKWLVHSMGSDSPPLRAIAVRFVATALRSVNVPNANLPKTKNYLGWNKQTTSPQTLPVSPALGLLKSVISTACPEFEQDAFMGRVIQNLNNDHVFKTAEEDRGGGGIDPMMAHALRKFHFAGRFSDIASVVGQFLGTMATPNQQDATGHLLGELLRVERQWPYTRVPLETEGFNTVNARLFKGIFKLQGTRAVSSVKAQVESLLSQTDRASQSTAAEILAGALRVAHKKGTDATDQAWTAAVEWIISTLMSAILAAPPECIVDWMACVRFGVYNIDPSRVVWLLDRLFSSYSTSTTASSQAKPLYYIKAILSELTWRAPELQVKLLENLYGSLAHPYKQLRQEIGEIISLVVAHTWEPVRDSSNIPLLKSPELPSQVSGYLVRAFADANPSLVSDQPTHNPADEAVARITHLRATLLHATIDIFREGHIQGVLPVLPEMIGSLFAAQTDADHDVSKEARQACGLVAQAFHNAKSVSGLIPALFNIFKSPSWRVRSAILPFLQIMVYNNIFIIEKSQLSLVYEHTITMLNDPQIEVRELARGALSSLLKAIAPHSVPESYSETRLATFFTGKLKGAERHQGVLGLAAVVGAHPYDMPHWLPDFLVSLARQVGGTASAISDTAKKGLMEFWRTHQDTWAEEEQLLTSDQLYALKETMAAPSYFA